MCVPKRTRPMKINVLLADGRKIGREGLALLLERHEDLSVIGEAADVAGAVKIAKALPADVVVFTLTSSILSAGAGAVKKLARARRQRPVRVIVLTMRADDVLVRGLLEAGAAGCLTKDAAGAELVEAIRIVRAGKVYLSPSLLEVVVGDLTRPAGHANAARPKPLAPRERVILERIAGGETTKQTAAALGVSTKTVETLRRRIMEKLDRHSVADLTKYAVAQGIASLEEPA